ncbi:APC family permease, partial [Patulibacter sp. S7RM1-6]
MATQTAPPAHPPTAEQHPSGLKRELKVADAAAFSVGLMGPVGAMALLGTGAVGILGRGAFLAFVLALVGVALVAYGFVRLSRHISHTGSVYALVGVTLGPRAGFLAGWALVGAYTAIGAGSIIEIGLFGGEFLQGIGVVDSVDWVILALVGLALVGLLSLTEISRITKALLGVELLGAALVVGLCVVIVVRLATGHAPGDQSLSLDIVALPSGTGVGTIFSAAVFGFLAFAGFEGAAALGEETQNPRREIPRALKIAIGVVGAFYLFTMAAQSWGFGTSDAGVAAFASTESAYGELSKAYVGQALSDALNLVATLSLFAILLGTANGAARILYALARDAGVERGVGRLSRHGAPTTALGLVLLVVLAIVVGQKLAGSQVLDATFYALTVGTIALLAAYFLATLGALRFLFAGRIRRAPAWQAVVPALGLTFVAYVIWKNVHGVDFPYDQFWWIVGAWLLVGLAVVAFVPGLAGRVRAGLAASGDGPLDAGDADAAP